MPDNGLWKNRFIDRKIGVFNIYHLLKKPNDDFLTNWVKIIILVHDIYISVYTDENKIKKRHFQTKGRRYSIVEKPEYQAKLEDLEIKAIDNWLSILSIASKYRFNAKNVITDEIIFMGCESEEERDEILIALETRRRELHLLRQCEDLSYLTTKAMKYSEKRQ